MAKIMTLSVLDAASVDGTETVPVVKNGETYRSPTGPLLAPHIAKAASYAALAQSIATSVRRALVIDYGDTGIVEAPRYRSTAGRAFRNAQGYWEFSTLDDQEIVHYDTSGNIVGVDFSPAASYVGAPFNTGTAPGTADPLYLSKTTATTVSYSGAHTYPSIYGATGLGMAINFGTYAYSNPCSFPNITQAFVAGDLIRVEAIVAVQSFTTAQTLYFIPSAVSGTIPTLTVALSLNADGTVASATSSARRWGYSVFGTYGGVTFYLVWSEGKATAAGTVRPGFQAAAYASGMSATRTLLVEDVRLIKNGPTLPNMAPVCGTKTFGDSYYQTNGSGKSINMKFDRMRRGRTAVWDGTIRPASATYRSGPRADPYLHAESRIELELSREQTSYTFLRPNYYQMLDLTPNSWSEAYLVYVSDEFFDADIVAPSTATYPTYEIRGAFSAPKRWGQIRSVNTNVTRNPGTMTLRHIHLFPRASTQGEQIGQTFTTAQNIGSVGQCSMTEMAISGHTQHHSRGYLKTFFGETYKSEDCRWLGVASHVGQNYYIRDVCYNRMSRGFGHLGSSTTTPIVLDIKGIRGEKLWSDFIYFGRGIYSGTIDTAIRQGSTVSLYDVYHARDQICVDIGNGIQTLDEAGLAVTDLPTDRQVYLYSYRPNAGEAIVTDADDLFLWKTQSRITKLYPPSTEGGAYPGYMANMGDPVFPNGAYTYAGEPGPKFTSFAAAEAAGLPVDMTAYVYCDDTGSHADPYTGEQVLNRGVYKMLRGYGLCRLADTWPHNSGKTYTTLADLQAVTDMLAYARAIVTEAGDAYGVYEYSTTLGWVKLAINVTLPVYASTPGVPSAANPHIFCTIDNIKKTGASTFTFLTSSSPAETGASTHPDYMQLNLQYATLDGLLIQNNVLWDVGQFFFLQGGASSPVKNITIRNNIGATDMYNAFYIRPETWLPGYEQVIENNLVLNFKPRGFDANGSTSYPWLDSTNVPAGQLQTDNNWFAAPTGVNTDTNAASLTNPRGTSTRQHRSNGAWVLPTAYRARQCPARSIFCQHRSWTRAIRAGTLPSSTSASPTTFRRPVASTSGRRRRACAIR
ncbi:hypothetical protein [Novosphingobium sp. 9]|uniref:hypothetical protein n=1 Tax=Novosphingobium sp. 9 TaxID=2025349 RepID=UPI0021B62BDC|nr:hypothetical protein [Novosphingobium sp. 9]